MATITKRNGKYRVQIRKHNSYQSRTFTYRRDAVQWAKQMDIRAETAGLPNRDIPSVSQGLDRLWESHLRNLKGAYQVWSKVGILKTHLGTLRMDQVDSQRLAQYRDARLCHVGAQTVTHEIRLLKMLLKTAKTEWGMTSLEEPGCRLPRLPAHRDRVVSPDEERRLQSHVEPLMGIFIGLAIETAMRRSELLGIRWTDIDWEGRVVHLGDAKTGARDVPLSRRAVDLLVYAQEIRGSYPRVFPWSKRLVSAKFTRACKNAGIHDARIHDLRHTALTRWSLRGLDVWSLRRLGGHSSVATLGRYVNLKASDVVAKMDGVYAPEKVSSN